ncbi:hypothetical protein SS50377_26166 [Spironucleus salmonicida]|uniref:Uncharacterized protein n=1 Tax=Spironucleus salmonicida TaxID=348837 RepID=A0A9P8LPU1_9EUKA|nr:hypothetical protein SS50377_26166 [Spironucleus salmonicida]
MSDDTYELALEKHPEFYNNIIQLNESVESYKQQCIKQEHNTRELLFLEQKLEIRIELLNRLEEQK